MKRLKVRTDGKTLRAVKQTVFLAVLKIRAGRDIPPFRRMGI